MQDRIKRQAPMGQWAIAMAVAMAMYGIFVDDDDEIDGESKEPLF
jgi:hypothetical protein